MIECVICKLTEGLRERTEHLDISLFLRPSLNGVLFTGGRGMSDFSVLKYY